MLSNSKGKDAQERNCRMIIQDSKASPETSAEPDVDFRGLREQVVDTGRGALQQCGVRVQLAKHRDDRKLRSWLGTH